MTQNYSDANDPIAIPHGAVDDELELQDNNDTSEPRTSLGKRLLGKTAELWSQLTISEISGSCGDLGTFIPLVVALARKDAIRLGPALFFAGLANIITGIFWDIPMCVQPMKAIAAVAISEGLSHTQVTAAGIWMGVFLILLSITDGIELVNFLVPTPVVSGIQMGVGINLAIRGALMIHDLSWFDEIDCIILGLACGILCMYLLRWDDPRSQRNENSENNSGRQRQSSAPVGVYLFGLGMFLGGIRLYNSSSTQSIFQWFGEPVVTWALEGVTWQDWKESLLQGAIPQIPLTTLNSVVSVCCLAHTLYPEKRTSQFHDNVASDSVISRKEVSWSVGLMNLLLCPLGAMPCCHGAGGLAGQHKFGARHGASVVFLGLSKMVLSIFWGGSLLVLMDSLPTAILGVMLLISGHELAMSGLSALVALSMTTAPISAESQLQQETHQGRGSPALDRVLLKNATITLLTVIIDVGLHKTHYAAVCGWVAYIIYGDGIIAYRSRWDRRHFDGTGIEYAPVSR